MIQISGIGMSISSGFQVCKPATIFAHDVSRKRERSPAASLQYVKASTRHKRARDSTRKGVRSNWAGLGYWASRTARHLCGLNRPHCSCALRGETNAVRGNRAQCGVKIDRTAFFSSAVRERSALFSCALRSEKDRTAHRTAALRTAHCALSGRTAVRSARSAARSTKATALLSTMSFPPRRG
jgi:hypothetical protein